MDLLKNMFNETSLFGIVLLVLIIVFLWWRRRVEPQREKARDELFQKIAQKYGLDYVKIATEFAGGLLRDNYGAFRTIEGTLGGKKIKIQDSTESIYGGASIFWQTEYSSMDRTICYVDDHEELPRRFRMSEKAIISFLESIK